MIRTIAGLLCIVAIMSSTAGNSMAEPKIVVKTKYYSITGSTSRELKNQVKRKGPGGHLAYTGWHVRWTGSCQITAEISYEYPKWENREQAPDDLRTKWDRMIAALTEHEKQHAQHGINAANEIEKTKCAGNPKDITNKWANQDKIFDAETNYGKKQGVVLP